MRAKGYLLHISLFYDSALLFCGCKDRMRMRPLLGLFMQRTRRRGLTCVCVCVCVRACMCWSNTNFLTTCPQVEHRLLDVLPAIKRGKVRGQMVKLAVAGKEQQVCFKEDVMCVNG